MGATLPFEFVISPKPVSRELARVPIAAVWQIAIIGYLRGLVTEQVNLNEQKRVETIEEIATLPLNTESVLYHD